MSRLHAGIVLTAVSRLRDGRPGGFWVAEAAYPWRALATCGWRVSTLSTADAEPEHGAIDRSDPIQRDFLLDPVVRRELAGTRRAETYSAQDFDVMVVCGGPGALHDLALNPTLGELIGGVVARGGVVAALGHGVAALLETPAGERGLLRDRMVAAPTVEEERIYGVAEQAPFQLAAELRRRGARQRPGRAFHPHVVHDGAVLTAQNPASAPLLATCLLSATSGLSPAGANGPPTGPH